MSDFEGRKVAEKIDLEDLLLSIVGRKRKKPEDIEPSLLEEMKLEYENSSERTNNQSLLYTHNNIYSEEFLKQFKNKLGNPETFNKANDNKKKKIQEKVDTLFFIESHYKQIMKKTVHNSENFLILLDAEYKKFKKSYGKALQFSNSSKAVNKKFLSPKINTFLNELLEEILTSSTYFDLEETAILRKMNLNKILPSIKTSEVFMLLCSCAVRIGYKNITDSQKIVKDDFEILSDPNPVEVSHLKISRLELKNVVKKRFTYLLVSLILLELGKELESIFKSKREGLLFSVEGLRNKIEKLNIPIKKSGYFEGMEVITLSKEEQLRDEYQEKIKDLEEMRESYALPEDYHFVKLNIILKDLKKNHYLYETHGWYELIESSTESILDIFQNTVAAQFYNVTSRNSDGFVTTTTVLELPRGLDEIYSFSDHLPRITPPQDWDSDGYVGDKSLMKAVHFGVSNPKFDPKTIESINATQKKKFRINSTFLSVLKELDKAPLSETEGLDLPFSTVAEIRREEQDLVNCKKP